MASPAIVCPPEPELLRRLRGRRAAVRVSKPDEAAPSARAAREAGVGLVCLIVPLQEPLSGFEPPAEWKGLPLALFAPELGRFRDLAPRLPGLRDLDLRVYLPATPAERLDELRILASVGLACAARIGPEEPDWEALADLATYAILERTPHAPVEPFAFVAAHIAPGRNLVPWQTLFDEPEAWVHMDLSGRFALSEAEAARGRFVGDGPEALDRIGDLPPWRERLLRRRGLVLSEAPCARCAGFRLCLGRFLRPDGSVGGCSSFFAELVALASEAAAKAAETKERSLWQP